MTAVTVAVTVAVAVACGPFIFGQQLIHLFDEGNDLVMQLTDDGIGIDEQAAANATSPGLIGIHERAARINATFGIRRNAGGGTTATVRVPRSFIADTGQAEHTTCR